MLFHLLGLCKIKVVALLVLTAVVGMYLASNNTPDILLVFLTMLGIGLSASSAAVFNHIVDKKIDKEMARTHNRPLAQEKIKDRTALIFGLSIGIIGFLILWFFINHLTAILTLISLIGYAVIYTMYLKRATPQNIVIGGAAGAAPPVLGWVAVTGTIDPNALLLFLIIFIWTPPHFWALAIYRAEEYQKAGVPMLPVTHGKSFTRIQILLYTILLIIVTIFPYLVAMSGLIYLTISLILGLIFLYHTIMIIKKPNNIKIAHKTFIFSINYLMLLFITLLIDHYYLIRL